MLNQVIRQRWAPASLVLTVPLLLALTVVGASPAQAQKYGGILRVVNRGNPATLSIHETATTTTTYAIMSVYNNLVFYDYFVRKESPESIRAELAERWRWSKDNRELTFTLRRGVNWHDGKPFTTRDVQYTFDGVRGASSVGMKLNPRKLWYGNVKEIATNGDHEVTFKLDRPQPSLLSMLAGGYSAVYPEHVGFAKLRTTAVGTGPFTLKQYLSDQSVVLEKNRHYFKQALPYLDGIEYPVIKNQASRVAALISGQIDAFSSSMAYKPTYDQLKEANAGLDFTETHINTTINIITNHKKPPFDNPRLRLAVNLAMDRAAIIRGVYDGVADRGGAMIPAPWGVWGLTAEQLAELPGYGNGASQKAEARRILAEEGYGADHPLKLRVSTRNQTAYVEPATWALGELKAVGIDVVMERVETGLWYGKVARKDFEFGINATAIGIDDPDAVLYENYSCDSQRNYTGYCNPEIEKKFDAQSQEADFDKRHAIVQAIDTQLQREGARPYLVYRVEFFPRKSYVKNWIPHQSVYNWARLEHVWLDK